MSLLELRQTVYHPYYKKISANVFQHLHLYSTKLEFFFRPYYQNNHSFLIYQRGIGGRNENRKTIWANSEEEMFEKLYEHYFNTEYTFEKVFEQMCNERSLGNNVLPKTIQEYKKDYKRFFAGTTLASKDIRRIHVC